MKRRIFSFLALIAMIFTLSSCILPLPSDEGNSSGDLIGHSLDYIYNEDDYIKAREGLTNLPSMLSEDGRFDLIYDTYLDLDKIVSEIATYANMEYLKTSIKQNDASNEKYLDYKAKLKELVDLERDFLKEASLSSYKESFFPNMSDKEIEESLGATYPDEFYTLDGEVEKLLVDYRKLSRKEMLKKAPELYSKVVENYNKMAVLAGYDNYLDYSYPNIYSRDYMPSESKDFSNYVRKYIVPELKEGTKKVDEIAKSLDNKNLKAFNNLVRGSFIDNRATLNQYAKFMGSSFYMAYEGLWSNGYYFFSNDSKAIDGAYTTYLPSLNTPAVYFGPNYQSIMTVCHEFGHYLSYILNDGRGGSFDLAETQSQSNELLFLSFIEREGDYFDKTKDAFRDYQIQSYLSTIVMATIVNDFEYRVYTENILDPSRYDEVFIEVCNSFAPYDELKEIFGINPEDYWKMVALDNAGYYISYAVSLVPSLEIYILADENINLARDAFNKLTYKVYVEDDYNTTLANAGLISPFVEAAYQKIPALF